MVWTCSVCGYVYDPADGSPVGARFEDLPEDWVCPLCGAARTDFCNEKGDSFKG